MATSDALTWADLFVNGSLIDLDISTWDGLVRGLPEDLGIAQTDELKDAMTFGHERLVPSTALQGIRDAASRARRIVEGHTIPFDLVPGSRFSPRSLRQPLLDALAKVRTEFQLAVNLFLEKYESYRLEHRDTLHKALLQASKRQDVADAALARIVALYPTMETLRVSFNMTWNLFSIAAPRDGADGAEQASQIAAEIGHMVDKTREQLTTKVGEIMALATRGGRITEKTYNSALRFCERVERLNIFCDVGLQHAVARVRSAIESAKGTQEPGPALTAGLDTVQGELSKSREAAINNAAATLAGQSVRRFS